MKYANIIDPSARIRQKYIAHIVLTVDGRLLTGLLADSNAKTITLSSSKLRINRDVALGASRGVSGILLAIVKPTACAEG